MINKGSTNTINSDDFGILLAKTRVPGAEKGSSRLVYKPVAKLKAVKVSPNSSVWMAFKTFIPERMRKGEKLLFLSESALLAGRRELDIDRMVIVDEKAHVAQSLKNELVEDGSYLVEKGDSYTEGKVLHDKEEHFDNDITLVDLEVWKDTGLPGERHSEGFYKSPHAREFSKRIRVHRFEKMVAMFMKKFNDPKFTLEELRGGSGSTSNYYAQSVTEGVSERKRKEKLYADLRSEGANWSDDYSDEELSELLYNVGAVRERERIKVIGAQVFDYQVSASYALNLLNNENLEDEENTEANKQHMEGSFEWYLFKNIEDLKAFSLEASIRRSQDAFTTGDYNATGVEYSAAFGLNWHPFAPPNALETNIFYVGALFRYGSARYEISSLGEEGNYQVVSFPGLRAGIKYNFQNRYGIRLGGGFENIIGDRTIRSEDEGELPDRVSHLEGKLSIGLSRFF